MGELAQEIKKQSKATTTTKSKSTKSAIVEYKSLDGTNVKLTPAIVLKHILTKNANVDDREIFSFMAMCQARRLNPLAKDCYFVAYKGTANVIVSKDFFIRTANMHKTFNGMQAGVIVQNDNGGLEYREGSLVLNGETLIGGWCDVYDKRRQYPSKAVVSLDEYNSKQSIWLTKPATMIRKVAIVQALREAYPESYGGIYDSAEVNDQMVGDVDVIQEVEKLSAPTPQPQPQEKPQDEVEEMQIEPELIVDEFTGEIYEPDEVV